MRLTRRGRVVVSALGTIAVLLVVALAWLSGIGSAQAAGRAVPPGQVYRNLTTVVVRPGESLWSIAERAAPSADPRVVIGELVDLNGLRGSTVQAGQRLLVPRG